MKKLLIRYPKKEFEKSVSPVFIKYDLHLNASGATLLVNALYNNLSQKFSDIKDIKYKIQPKGNFWPPFIANLMGIKIFKEEPSPHLQIVLLGNKTNIVLNNEVYVLGGCHLKASLFPLVKVLFKNSFNYELNDSATEEIKNNMRNIFNNLPKDTVIIIDKKFINLLKVLS